MAKEKICGVYKIENLVNGKVYIGSSKDIYKRWNEHLNYLHNKKHHSCHLQFSWDKYGENNFKFEIVEICLNNDHITKEQYWIDFYKSYDINYGYNIRPKADLSMISEETKIKMSLKAKGSLNSQAIINDEQAIRIINLLSSTNFSFKEIAKIENINVNIVYNIYYRASWKDLSNNIIFYKRNKNGENSCFSKLKEKDVLNIINRLLKEENCSTIALDYNVSENAINNIKNKKKWKYLTKYIIFPFTKSRQEKGGKLTIEQVINIRKLLLEGCKYKEISDIYNVDPSTIGLIKRNKTWKNVI